MKKISVLHGDFALIDDDDYDRVSAYKWRVINKIVSVDGEESYYPYAYMNGKYTPMHRFILGYYGRLVIDHINRNKLDNRRENLRICTVTDNNRNKKINIRRFGSPTNPNYEIKYLRGYFGIYYCSDKKRLRPWRAQIRTNRTHINIGYFKTAEEAAEAYNKRAIELWGDKANLNIIEDNINENRKFSYPSEPDKASPVKITGFNLQSGCVPSRKGGQKYNKYDHQDTLPIFL